MMVGTPGARQPRQRVVRAQTEPGLSTLSFRSLPPDLVEQSRVRLSWMAGAAIVATLSIASLARLLQPEVAEAQQNPIVRLTLLFTVLASGAMIGAVLWRRVPAVTVLRAGLVYEVLIAAAIAVLENAMPWNIDEVVRGTSGIVVWLTAFALLVPAPPFTAVYFSLAAAAMGPALHFVLAPKLEFETAQWNRLLIYYLPSFLMAIAAGLINRWILKLEWTAARVRELGSYDLVAKLAHGGMGEVWRARHRLLKREAAVKLIRPEVLMAHTGRGAQALLIRFEHEAQAIAALRSPHTVSIFDFGMTEDGSLYYAMELLEGLDLEKLVKRFGPQPAPRVVHLLRQACDSLAEAHRRGMVHRDIKPTNLFLCHLGVGHDFCKLLDFGLVKQFGPEEGSLVTMEGSVAGTPAFLAPEIAVGAKNVDGRADLYGLGCVAYWLLTGHLVFPEPNTTAMAIAHVRKQPVPPSQRTEMKIPEELERLVLRCLAKDPAERPESAAELENLLASCPGIAGWDAREAEKWWRTHLPVAAAPDPELAEPGTAR